MPKPIIALHGKMRSGKDLLGAALCKHFDIPIFRFATPLKAAHAALGLGDGEVVKDREWLQEASNTLTDRDPDHFVKLFAKQHPDLSETGAVIVDMRKPAEFSFLKAKGAVTGKLVVPTEVLIERGAEAERMGHSTETELDFIPDEGWDVILLHPWHTKRYPLADLEKYGGSISALQVIAAVVESSPWKKWLEDVQSGASRLADYVYPTEAGWLGELMYRLSRVADEASHHEDGNPANLRKALVILCAVANRWWTKLDTPKPASKQDDSPFARAVTETYGKALLKDLGRPHSVLRPQGRDIRVSPTLKHSDRVIYGVVGEKEPPPFPDYGEMERMNKETKGFDGY